MSEMAIREGGGPDLPKLKPHWMALYDQQRKEGLLTSLPDDAFEKWARSLEAVLGRFGCLFLAEDESKVIGFLAGRIRTLPPHFGGEAVGYVSEVYVSPGMRGQGLGRELLDRAHDWFRANECRRIELHVVTGNAAARRFYARLGWQEELVQMVWQPRP